MSDFDKEAEREKLREKFEQEEDNRAATEQMSELLLKGATMTNATAASVATPSSATTARSSARPVRSRSLATRRPTGRRRTTATRRRRTVRATGTTSRWPTPATRPASSSATIATSRTRLQPKPERRTGRPHRTLLPPPLRNHPARTRRRTHRILHPKRGAIGPHNPGASPIHPPRTTEPALRTPLTGSLNPSGSLETVHRTPPLPLDSPRHPKVGPVTLRQIWMRRLRYWLRLPTLRRARRGDREPTRGSRASAGSERSGGSAGRDAVLSGATGRSRWR